MHVGSVGSCVSGHKNRPRPQSCQGNPDRVVRSLTTGRAALWGDFSGLRKSGEPLFCVWLSRRRVAAGCGFCAGRGALPRDRRRISQNRLFGFCNPTSVMIEGSVFILVRRATPVARERAPTGCIPGPRRCTGQPAAHGYSTGSGVLSLYHGLGSDSQCRANPSGRDRVNPQPYRRRRSHTGTCERADRQWRQIPNELTP
jgi:hypothetical protein